MSRPAIDTVLRSFKNALANWELVVIRIVEFGAFIAIAITAIVTTILPIAVAAGLGTLNVRDVEGSAQAIVRFISEHGVLLGWFIGGATIALTIMLAIHSFIVAGSVRLYRDAERSTTGEVVTFHKFDLDVFWESAWEGWLRVFWVYNLGVFVPSLIVLVPLLFLAVLGFLMPGAAWVFGILAIITTCLLGLVAFALGGLWIYRALGESAVENVTAREALNRAYRAVRSEFVNHFLVAAVVFIVSLGGTSLVEMIASSLFDSTLIEKVVSTICWSLSGAWMLAAFVGLAEEKK